MNSSQSFFIAINPSNLNGAPITEIDDHSKIILKLFSFNIVSSSFLEI